MKSLTATIHQDDTIQLISSTGEIFWAGVVPGAYAAASERLSMITGVSLGVSYRNEYRAIDCVSIVRDKV